MQKNLFTKYFSICASMILISIISLGIILMAFASSYFSEDKFRLLNKSAENAVNITMNNYRSNDFKYLDSIIVSRGYSIISEAINADIFLVSSDGKTLICTDQEQPCNHHTYLVPQKIINEVYKTGYYEEVSTVGRIYNKNYYTVGLPIRVNNEIVSILFMSTSASGLSVFLNDIFEMFIGSALAVMAIAFIIIYFATRKMVSPLRNMVSATQAFGKGDFTVRVPVDNTDEIGKLAMSFNNMATSLATLESVRRSFIANVSHELKTPMTTIAGFIDGILDGTIEKDKQQKYLNIVSSEVKRLSRLVRSMLNIARIEAGEMQISPSIIDINEIVCKTIFTFEQPIEAKNIDIQGLDIGKIMVCADKDLIHQVVYNLLENAVKFVNEGGYIQISYTRKKDMTYVGIKNSGMGIPKEEITKVFDRFYKTDKSRGLDKKGVGLGLHIVRSIVNLHKGEIIVRSVEGEYCEFLFSIPSQTLPNSQQTHFKGNKK